jgi:hypothetical protein
MKCEDADAAMLDYLDKTLDEKKLREIENHLETCERCLDDFRDSQKVLKDISEEQMEIPDESVKINFYHMLHSEIKKNEKNSPVIINKTIIHWYNNFSYRIAAGIALLIGGTFLGMIMHSQLFNTASSPEFKQLQSEVTDLKKSAMFTMLKETSSSDRIQAVSYADRIENPDEKVIEVLIQTLNTDKNVNVRMAAAYALSKFADQRSVCDSLVNSLTKQSDPILQVTLINILVERKEKSALMPIQKIIANKSTLKEVRAVAENGLRTLI